jgi:PAS domain S-box-containing protein
MESELRRIVDAIPGLVWTALPDGQIDFLNQRWCQYTGLRLDESYGRGWQTAIHHEDLPRLLAAWRSDSGSSEPVETEVRLRGADGKCRWFLFRAHPSADGSGHVMKWCGLGTNVDDRKRAEEILQRRELDFQLILDSLPIPVAITTPSGEVEGLNQLTVDYFGRTFDELREWKASDVVHPDDLERTIANQRAAHEAGRSYNVESRHRRADGAYRWFNVLGLPVRDAQGHILRWFHLLIDVDERKRAMDALLASERDLKLTIDTIPAVAWSARSDGSADFFNRTYLDYLGLSLEEAQDWGWMAAVHPDDLPALANSWQSILSSGRAGEAEARLRRHNGEYRWFLFRASPLCDESGQIVKWYGTNTDIEDRKRAEEALCESEHIARQIVDSIPGLVAIFTPSGEVERVNRQVLEYFGMTFEELRNWGNSDAVHPEDLPRCVESFAKSVASGEPFEWECRARRSDGVYRWFQSRGSPLRDANGSIVRWHNLLIDIDERRRAEDALRRNEAFLAEGQRLSQTGTFLWRVDDTNEIMFSEELYRIFEFDSNSVPTVERVHARLHPEDVPLSIEYMNRVRTGASYVDHDLRLQMPDGRIKHTRVVGQVLCNPEGLECVGAVQDVTQRKVAEESLDKVRSELTRVTRALSLGALTASIAHEVNQPLAAIITNASTCLRMLGADPPNIAGARETARRTVRDGNRAADVITRLRALFSRKAAAIETVDLNEAAREALSLTSNDLLRNSVILRVEIGNDQRLLVTGDRVQLQQVILNLVRNASEAMSEVNDRPRHLIVRADSDEDGRARLMVKDVGAGFELHVPDKLFDPFYTTKSDGMGIGLSISRSIIEHHGGKLWAEPNCGPGATFWFFIPRQPTSDEIDSTSNDERNNLRTT